MARRLRSRVPGKVLCVRDVLRYEVRYYPAQTLSLSERVGTKLLPRMRANRVVRWMNSRGRDAFMAPVKVRECWYEDGVGVQ